jgi:hypothetical protein
MQVLANELQREKRETSLINYIYIMLQYNVIYSMSVIMACRYLPLQIATYGGFSGIDLEEVALLTRKDISCSIFVLADGTLG